MFHSRGHLMVLLQVKLVIMHNLALSRHQANWLIRGSLVSLFSQFNLFNEDNLLTRVNLFNQGSPLSQVNLSNQASLHILSTLLNS